MLHRLLEGLETGEKNSANGDGSNSSTHQQLTPESKPKPVIGRTPCHTLAVPLSIRWFRLGIGLDSCVIPLRHGGLFLVQSTDFFYPLVDDPYVMVLFDRHASNR